MASRLGQAKRQSGKLAMRLGKDMRLRRTTMQLSEHAFARQASISQGYIGLLEKGKRNPTLEFLVRVANGLECRLEVNFVSQEKKV